MSDSPQKQAKIKHIDEFLAVIHTWIVSLYIQMLNIGKSVSLFMYPSAWFLQICSHFYLPTDPTFGSF